MTKDVEQRCVMLGEYIAQTGATVRVAGNVFGVSKSTVHTDVTKRLEKASPELAKKVKTVLQNNKAQRHIRGGNATKQKYLKLKKN